MENKTSKNVLLVIMGVLTIVTFVLRLTYIQQLTLPGVISLVVILFVALYGFFLYKVPHGNLMKYTMLLFAFGEMLKKSYHFMINNGIYLDVGIIIMCGLICYGAGRLNRIEQNKILFPAIELYFVIYSIVCLIKSTISDFIFNFGLFFPAIVFGTIMIAYFTRYDEHKEAGLMDKPKA